MDEGILFVLSGPSGVGKGTVLDKLFETYQDVNYSISATTRRPRENEVDGEDYYFISEDKFSRMKKNGEFIETARVHNNFYGTPKKYVDDCLARGEDIILEIDIQGAEQVRKKYPRAVYIFLVPPSFDELEHRLEKRGSESENTKKVRLENARDEMKEIIKYDYIVVNDTLGRAVEKIKEIIVNEKNKRRGIEDDN